jgi:hypothetical protein
MLKHYGYKPYGLNTKYRAKFDRNNEALFNDDFDTVFVPQPTPLINVVTSEKSWFVAGSIGQKVFYSLWAHCG